MDNHIKLGDAYYKNKLTDTMVKHLVSRSAPQVAAPIIFVIAVILFGAVYLDLVPHGSAVILTLGLSFVLAGIGIIISISNQSKQQMAANKIWYKDAKIIVGIYQDVKVHYNQDKEISGYSVSFIVPNEGENKTSFIDVDTYNDYVSLYTTGDEIFVLRYKYFNQRRYGYRAFCPYRFENESSFKEPQIALSAKQKKEAEKKTWEAEKSDNW